VCVHFIWLSQQAVISFPVASIRGGFWDLLAECFIIIFVLSLEYKMWHPYTTKTGSTILKKWTTPEFRSTPSTTNLEEEEIVDVPRNDGNASMQELVKRRNPWRKMMMMMMLFSSFCLSFFSKQMPPGLTRCYVTFLIQPSRFSLSQLNTLSCALYWGRSVR
jgi:hypothetical protein